jgi:O-methyltransferase
MSPPPLAGMSPPPLAGIAPGAGPARQAYLELLALALCDLVGSTTSAVEPLPHGGLAAVELAGDGLERRVQGRDWPRHALTMTGLARLADLRACVEQVVGEAVPGDMIEAGAWRGGSSMLMRATLDSLGEGERSVWVADSFQGFPRDAGASAPQRVAGPYLAAFDFLAVPLDEVRASFRRLGLERGVHFLPGFFAETLPGLGGSWSLIRLDGDTYDATLLALRSLYPGLSRGGHVIIDDYAGFAECREAVEDFRAEAGVREPVHPVDWTCARWRRESEPEPDRRPATLPPATSAPPARPPAPAEIPSHRQRALEQELAQLRGEHAELRQSLERARGELGQMSSSTSWRLTRPLRELSLRARGGRR